MSTRRTRFQIKPNTRQNTAAAKVSALKSSPKNDTAIELKDKETPKTANSTVETPIPETKPAEIKENEAIKVSPIETQTPQSPVKTRSADSESSKPVNNTETPTESKVKPPAVRARLCKAKPKIVPRIPSNTSQTRTERRPSISEKPIVNKEKDTPTTTLTTSQATVSTKETQSLTKTKPPAITNAEKNITPSSALDSIVRIEDVGEVSGKVNDESSPKSNDRISQEPTFSVVETQAAAATKSISSFRENARHLETAKPKKKIQRRFKPGADPPEKKKMKMMDLIFWNPLGNAMTQKSPSPNKTPAKSTATDERRASVDEEEEVIDNPEDEPPPKPAEPEDEPETVDLPGPRVIIGEDGQITIDESSLVIEQTPTGNDISSQEIVYDASDTTYASFKKPKDKPKSFWTLRETAKFYKTLSVVGTDFTLMSNLFPERTRVDLKNKFKKEERLRKVLVDKAIKEWHNFDLNDVESFLAEDTIEQALIQAENAKAKKKSKKKDENEGDDFQPPKRQRRKKNTENKDAKKKTARKSRRVIEDSEEDEIENIDDPSMNDEVTARKEPENSLDDDRDPDWDPSKDIELVEMNMRTPDNKRTRTLSESTVEWGSRDSSKIKPLRKKSVDDDEQELYLSESTVGIPSPEPAAAIKTSSNTEVTTTVNHPTLNSLLNQSTPDRNTGSTNMETDATTSNNSNLSMGQLILVAGRTPTNEQIVHVYLMSGNENEISNAPSSNNESSDTSKSVSLPTASGNDNDVSIPVENVNEVKASTSKSTDESDKTQSETDEKSHENLGVISLEYLYV